MKELPKLTKLAGTKRGLIVIAASIVAIATLIILAVANLTPERSIAAYCSVYREENSRLSKIQGDRYSVRIFSHKSDDAGEFSKAFARMERSAPEEIRQDVEKLHSLFNEIERDPSEELSASLSGLSVEDRVKRWTEVNCLNE